ncbi:MAG TPA: transposase family protein, partial [Pirellulales bacterium]|nr:transposase family protein [Pirellulales bacterium]
MQVDQEDIRQIMDDFATLEDPRCHLNRKHLLGDLIVICMCAVLAGCDGPIAIGRWAKWKQ